MGTGAFLFCLYSSLSSQAEYWTEYSEMIEVFVFYIWWQVPGVGNTGIQIKLSSYLFNMCRGRSPSFMCEASWMFGCGWQVCLSSQKSHFKDVAGWEDGESGHWILADRRGQTSLPALSRFIGGNFFWKGTQLGWVLMKEWTETIHLFQYLFSLCHLSSHYCWRDAVLHLKLSNTKWLCISLWHG